MAASGTIHGEQRLGVLDGLRGLAVLLVLWYHVWEISWLPAPAPWLEFVPETGFVGVHLFFFLSGFVIVYPFVRASLRGRPQPTWGHFASRRFLKIVPSYLLSIAVAYGIGYAQNQPNASPGPDLLTHLLFIHTWFPERYGSINGVLWTLAVEVEFYCIFPIVWWAFRRQPWGTAAAMIAIAWAWRWGSRIAVTRRSSRNTKRTCPAISISLRLECSAHISTCDTARNGHHRVRGHSRRLRRSRGSRC